MNVLILTGWGYHDYVAAAAATRYHIRRVYDKYGQNLSKAAEALKVARNTAKKYL